MSGPEKYDDWKVLEPPKDPDAQSYKLRRCSNGHFQPPPYVPICLICGEPFKQDW